MTNPAQKEIDALLAKTRAIECGLNGLANTVAGLIEAQAESAGTDAGADDRNGEADEGISPLVLVHRPGLVHVVPPDGKIWTERFDVPRHLSSLHLGFHVKTGEIIQPAGEKLFWLGWPNHSDLVAFAIVRQIHWGRLSGRGELLLVHDFGVNNKAKERNRTVFDLQPSTTYSVSLDVHPGHRVHLGILGPDAVTKPTPENTVTIDGAPNYADLPPGPKRGHFTFGGEGSSAEPTQPGWELHDLRIWWNMTEKRAELERHWNAAHPMAYRLGMRAPCWMTSIQAAADEHTRKYAGSHPMPRWLAHAAEGGAPGMAAAEKDVERRRGWQGGHRPAS